MFLKRAIHLVVLMSYVMAQSTYAQNLIKDQFASNDSKLNKMGKLYDPNCHSYVKSKGYIRTGKNKIKGKTEENLSNDLDQRTERYINWGEYAGKHPQGLTHDYLELIKSEDVKKAADKRYSEWDPIRPPPSLTLCDANPNMNECLAFKVYCTEQVASRAMEETLKKYEDEVIYCSDYYYTGPNARKKQIAADRQSKHPNYCKDDLVNKGSWIREHAQQVIQVASDKKNSDPAVKRYFTEVGNTFGQFIGDQKGLAESQQTAIKVKAAQDKYKKDLQLTKQAIKNCQDVVKQDDNDINGHDVSNYILNGMQCTPGDSLTTLGKGDLEKLAKDLDQIKLKDIVKEVDSEVNKAALKKTSMAIWASYEMMADKNDSRDLTTDVNYAVDELICNYGRKDPQVKSLAGTTDLTSFCTPERKKILQDAHKDFVALSNAGKIPYMDDASVQQSIKEELSPLIQEVNDQCKQIKSDYDKVQAETNKQMGALRRGEKYQPEPIGADTLKIGDQKVIIPKYSADQQRRMNHGDYWSPYDNGEGAPVPKEYENVSWQDYQEKKHFRSVVEPKFANTYSRMIQSRLGNLLITESFQKAMGTRDYEAVYESCRKGGSTGFKTPTVADVNVAKNEFQKLQRDELKSIAKQMVHPSEQIEDVQKYLKNNPLTIAQMLQANPSPDYAKALCAFIRDINADDEYWRNVKLVAAPVGLVAGVALSMTGIGAPAGAGLIGWVAGAGLVAATSAEVMALKRDINQARENITATNQASATFQQDTETALEVVKKNKEIKEDAEFWLPVTVILAAVDILPVGYARILKNFGKTNKGKAVLSLYEVKAGKELAEGSAEALQVQKGLQRGAKIFEEGAKKLKLKPAYYQNLSSEDQHFLFGLIGKMDDAQAQKFLKSLSEMESAGQVKRLLDLIARDASSFVKNGKISETTLAWALKESKKFKLPNGKVSDEFFETNLNTARTTKNAVNGVKPIEEMSLVLSDGKRMESMAVTRNGNELTVQGVLSDATGKYSGVNTVTKMKYEVSGTELILTEMQMNKAAKEAGVAEQLARRLMGENPGVTKVIIQDSKGTKRILTADELLTSSKVTKVDDVLRVSKIPELKAYSPEQLKDIRKIIDVDPEVKKFYQIMESSDRQMLEEVIGDMKYGKNMDDALINQRLKEFMGNGCKL